jgi:gamma-glutamyltranspeptidase/glutathione hydrolase
MVSVTKTISGFFGSGVVTKDTGIVLNNQMRGFAKGHGKKNSVIAGKKPLSSMSPTLILKENKPFAILGTPGGAKIISTVVQVISKLVDHKMSLKEAVYSPRIFNDMNNELLFENRISQNTINQLKSMGHKVNPLGQWDRKMGSVQSVLYKSHGEMEGVADPRRDGVVMGY